MTTTQACSPPASPCTSPTSNTPTSNTPFEAAALGLVIEVHRRLDHNHPTLDDITSSLWGACHGGHITTAVLLDHGADINWVGYDGLTPLDTARRSDATEVTAWLEEHGATSADQTA